MAISRCLKCDKKLKISGSPISGITKIKWFCEECQSPTCKRCGIILGDWICPACHDSHGEVYIKDTSLCLSCAESTGKIDIPAARRFIELFKNTDSNWMESLYGLKLRSSHKKDENWWKINMGG